MARISFFVLITLLLLTLPAAFACEPGTELEGSYLVRMQDAQANTAARIGVQSFGNSALPSNFTLISSPIREEPSSMMRSSAGVRTFAIANSNANAYANTYLAKISRKEAKALKRQQGVVSVEPDCRIRVTSVPRDTYYAYQWAHKSIHSEEAWNLKTSAKNIIVAVSDTGVDFRHEDLRNNMWINEKEINGTPEVDDDGNGYMDDIYGYDFAMNRGSPHPGPSPYNTHGTHVAGIIGAQGNNRRGVTGVAWRVKIMALKGFDDEGNGSLSALLKTIYYATDNGASIINCSWGAATAPGQAEIAAFRYALDRGVLPIVAAGNNRSNANKFTPAAIPGVLAVGAINQEQQLSTYSNWGNVVGILAPGGEGSSYLTAILSTLPENRYGGMAGTSMAAPFVAGAAALVKAIKPTLSPAEVKNLLINSGEKTSLKDPSGTRVYTRLNLFEALKKALGR